jgi:Ca2+-binding EF-hand superfamily protein
MMMTQAKNSPWFIQDEEIARFNKIFSSFDQNGQGFIPAVQMREIMEKTKLER